MVAKQLFLFALAVASTAAAPIAPHDVPPPQNGTSTANGTLADAPAISPSAVNFTLAEQIVSHNVLLRPTCPTGWGIFNVSDSIIMEDVPLPLAWDAVGKFCDVGWQGFDLFDSQGDCAKTGSVRTYGIGNFKLVDRLERIYETPSAKTQAPGPALNASIPSNAIATPPSSANPVLRRSWTSWLPFGWGDPAPSSSTPPKPHVPVAATNKTMDTSNIPNSGHRGKPIEPAAPSGSAIPASPPKLAAIEGANRGSGIVGHHYAPPVNAGPTQYRAMVYSQVGQAAMAGAKLSHMATILKLEKAAGGTRVEWDVVGCSDIGRDIEALLKETHAGAIANAGNRVRVANKIQPKKPTKPTQTAKAGGKAGAKTGPKTH